MRAVKFERHIVFLD